MASLIQLLRRIKTAQNISKTTRAMQMIAASRLKRAQDAALSSRPYVERLTTTAQELTGSLDRGSKPIYMQEQKSKTTLYIVISPDKGLCGGMITNLTREVVRGHSDNNVYITIGKKIETTMNYLQVKLLAAFPFGNTLPQYDIIYPITKLINEQFLTGKVGKVVILSTHFETVFTQKTAMTDLLPITLPEIAKAQVRTESSFEEFEPSAEVLLPKLLQRYIETKLYQEIIESYLAEQAARMISMQNATNNAKDMIEILRLEYNKSRQAKITSEILDISGGQAAFANS